MRRYRQLDQPSLSTKTLVNLLMAGHWTDLYSFVAGAIRGKELGYLILSNDDAARQRIQLSGIVQWKPTGWADGGQVPWRAAGAAIVRRPMEQLCLVGEFGQVLLLGSGKRHEELIGSSTYSPATHGPLRGLREIGDHIYCVGANRQAYKRELSGNWAPIPNGIAAMVDDHVFGFESVDGFDEQDIYACGWEGEIWKFDGKAWSLTPSIVGSVLTDICCAGDGNVYACGRNGLLVSGRDDRWSVMDLGEFSDDIWSLAWFGGHLYLATMDNLMTLEANGLHLVDWGGDRAYTCYRLVVGAGRLWSIGSKDAMSFDGTAWLRID